MEIRGERGANLKEEYNNKYKKETFQDFVITLCEKRVLKTAKM